MKLPPEDPRSGESDICGRLLKALYGGRTAGQAFEKHVAKVYSEDFDCVRGTSNPCLYSHPTRNLSFLHWGDDFVIAASLEDSDWLLGVLRTVFIVKDRGCLGPGKKHLHELTCLHRVFRWAEGSDAIEYEADPRHAELLIEQLNLKPAKKGGKVKAAASPGVDVKLTAETEADLEPELIDLFRSATMRAGYLALDRPDIAFAAKECARGMSQPLRRHFMYLKRLVRYLAGRPRLIWRWKAQKLEAGRVLKVSSDSNWAGCPVTRRSSSCCVLRRGAHFLGLSSTTQKPVSVSSGEAELYASAKAGSRLIGFSYMFHDLGFECSCQLETDSASAKGTLSRRGTGGIRHLETATMWIQDAVQRRKFTVHKVGGQHNVGDIGTKFLQRPSLDPLLKLLNLKFVDGRTAALPQVH